MSPLDRQLTVAWSLISLVVLTNCTVDVWETLEKDTEQRAIRGTNTQNVSTSGHTSPENKLGKSETIYLMGLTEIEDYPVSISSQGISQHRRGQHGVCQTLVFINGSTSSASLNHNRLSACFTDGGIPRLVSEFETTFQQGPGIKGQYYEAAKKLLEWQLD